MTETLIKKRKISITKIGDEYREKDIEKIIKEKMDMISVEVDKKKGHISVEYNLMQINFETIEKYLREMEIELSNKITEKFKRGIAKFTEQNELDNLKASPSSCCSDPKEICHKVK